jgi:hypothetical protein
LTATPTFTITALYTSALNAHPQSIKIKAAITAAIATYQNALSSVGSTTILFDVVSSGLGTLSNLFATTTIYKSTVFI